MPFITTPSQSPDGSPRSNTVWKLNGAHASPASTSDQRHMLSPSITYIPPLIDGACGTTPSSQRSIAQQLQNDVSQAARLLPSFVHGALTARMDIVEVVQHVGLALLETCMLVSAIPLCLCLPGALYATWLGCCSALVLGMSWSLNGRGARGDIVRSPSPAADGWMMGQEIDDERWFFVGGLGTSSRSLAKTTLPALAKLFSRTITAVHQPTYGLPVDFLSVLLQRSLNTVLPSLSSRTLYTQIRAALLDSNSNRTVVLAHNTGAIAISQVLRQLYSDIPTEKLSQLEIYTFGAAALEFAMPLGGPSGESKKTNGQQIHSTGFMTERRGPHIEHFAFVSDPFARMGVLRSVQEDLEGRFCGSVFTLNCPGARAHHGPRVSNETDISHEARKAANTTSTKQKSSSRPLMSLHDYMSCLFPDQGASSMTPPAQQNRSILDGLMHINRELAEKREFAALAKDSASHHTKMGKKRLSWTGLGATANGMNGNMDGVVGLEMARKGCKDCSGHRGREVSWLVRYVCIPTQFGLENQSAAEGASAGRMQ